ncbi:MAG: hypothetical protein ACE5O2_02875, partial [Armatimonadota bacterium]
MLTASNTSQVALRAALCLGIACLTRSPSAVAQQGSRIVVMDFTDASAYRTHALSRRAADAVAVALRGYARWEIVPRPKVRAALEGQNVPAPLSPAHGQMVADMLEAQWALTGTILECNLDETQRQVSVRLRGMVVDARTRQAQRSASASAIVRWKATDAPVLDGRVAAAIRQAAEVLAPRLAQVEPPAAAELAAESLVPSPPQPVAPPPEAEPTALEWPSREVRARVLLRTSKDRVLLGLGGRKGAKKGMVFTIQRAELDRKTGR